ncbi:hypothetical protein H5410_054325 [Solanum commersonii]|uniref:Leucine-rich repeat-containing N-terminal plant-type domain-containing protein n=1 Tax=Solanum commersonii TaxID=4109 RepID=A0A9J5WFR5_SOLCO|nr:hypothetical protein H5410_054325 [Solanum commersonii]
MTNSKIYWWLLILFIVNGWRCYCCWKEERTALLQLKANINYTGDGLFSSWMANKTSDCCQWEGIVCSNPSKRVTKLSIDLDIISEDTFSVMNNWYFNASLFIPFKNLKALLLPGLLAGWAQNEVRFEKLRQLEILDLSSNSLNRSIFQSLGQLSSLKSLYLAENNIESGSERLSGLDKLEILDLSYNALNDENVLSVLELNVSRTTLKKLDMRNNRFRSFIPNEEKTALLQLKANINYSTGNDYLSSWGANETSDCCQWEGIVCSNNTRRVVELSIIAKQISQEEQLRNVTDRDDMLRNWLFNASLFIPFKNLKALIIPGHSLAGWVKNEGFEKLRPLRKLERLDLSGNQFNRSIFQSLSQLSSLKSLNLSSNNIASRSEIWFTDNKIGSGSERLSGLDKLEILDLSHNNLEDKNVLSALELNTSRTTLKKLDIRYNRFQSFIPNEELGALRNIEYLLLDGNTLDENFLRSSGVMSSLKVLSVAQCNLNGTLPLQGLCDLKYLEELSLSRNSFIGKLPTCLGNLAFLRVIDLTQNQFTGNIALSPLSSLLSLEYLLIANNNFEVPISFESFANHSKLKFVIADY